MSSDFALFRNDKAKNIKGAVFVSAPIFKTDKKKVANFLQKPFDLFCTKKAGTMAPVQRGST